MLALIRRRRRVILVGCGVLALLVSAGLAYGRLRQPRPTVAWNTDPDVVVLRAKLCCAFMSNYSLDNTLAEAVIWGDGRIIWTEWPDDFSWRRVLTGQLTLDQLRALLQQYVEAGFFDWDEHYSPDMPMSDLAEQCVQVSLTSATHQVCEYERGAPADFHRLYDIATSGAGATGADYVPTKGNVIIYPEASFWHVPKPEDAVVWPAEALGVSLSDHANVLLEGEALALAWQVVNNHPWEPLVLEGDTYYMLVVRLPKLSVWPPALPAP